MKPTFVLPYKTPILTSHYTMGYELGEGQYGTTTHLCLDKSTNEPVACKSISKSNDDLPRRYDAWREIQIMHRVSVIPSAVTLRVTYEDSQCVHLVMDLCEGGNLFDWILEKGSSYSEREASRLMNTIVGFVQSCHSLGVMHRDLKPESFLFKSNDEDSPLLVVDFGFSVFFHEGDTFTEIVGNPYYVAPEVVKKSYGPEADVWSAGIILYILLYGAPPFAATNKDKLFDKILSGTLDLESKEWADISDDAKDLIRKMLEKDPKKRISTNDILCHPWMVDESNVPDKPLDAAVLLRLQQFSAISKAQELSWSLQRFLSSQLHLEEI